MYNMIYCWPFLVFDLRLNLYFFSLAVNCKTEIMFFYFTELYMSNGILDNTNNLALKKCYQL